jgi:hypothetical protein
VPERVVLASGERSILPVPRGAVAAGPVGHWPPPTDWSPVQPLFQSLRQIAVSLPRVKIES